MIVEAGSCARGGIQPRIMIATPVAIVFYTYEKCTAFNFLAVRFKITCIATL